MKLIATVTITLATLLSLVYLYFALISDEPEIFLWDIHIQEIFFTTCVVIVVIFILTIYFKTKT